MKKLSLILLAFLAMAVIQSCNDESLEMDRQLGAEAVKGAAYKGGLDVDDEGDGRGGEGNESFEPYTSVTVSGSNLNYEIWPCTAEDPSNQTPAKLSNFMGWEMAFRLYGTIYVAKATLSSNQVTFDDNKIYVTKATDFDAFTWNKIVAGEYQDMLPDHYTTWYADVSGGAANYYCPRLSEDEGWMIWTTSGNGIHFNLESTNSGMWDIIFDSFNSWYKYPGAPNPIEKYNLTPVTFNINNFTPELTFVGGNQATAIKNQNVNIQWNSKLINSDSYTVHVNGAYHGQTSGTNYTLSFSSDGVYNVKVTGRKTDQYGSVTSHVNTRGFTKTITVSSPVSNLTASISGPSSISLPTKKNPAKLKYRWTGYSSGGSGNKTYKWYENGYHKYTGKTYEKEFSYNNTNYYFTIELRVTDDNSTVPKLKTIQAIAGGGGGELEF